MILQATFCMYLLIVHWYGSQMTNNDWDLYFYLISQVTGYTIFNYCGYRVSLLVVLWLKIFSVLYYLNHDFPDNPFPYIVDIARIWFTRNQQRLGSSLLFWHLTIHIDLILLKLLTSNTDNKITNANILKSSKGIYTEYSILLKL